ncbi:MAG TPA: hypothetical protein PKD37_01265 [Oligoflexia bacterium]|nr:hypothetical protein [Oligoflexia bacterium]HMP26605.1 hypothetical protein [Oligoflexia bacterium]
MVKGLIKKILQIPLFCRGIFLFSLSLTLFIAAPRMASCQPIDRLIDDFKKAPPQSVRAQNPEQFERNAVSDVPFKRTRLFEVKSATNPPSANVRVTLRNDPGAYNGAGGHTYAEAASSAGNSFALWTDQTANNLNLTDPNTLGSAPFLSETPVNYAECQGVLLEKLNFDSPAGASTASAQAFIDLTIYDHNDSAGNTYSRARVELKRVYNNEDLFIPLSQFNIAGPAGAANLAVGGAFSIAYLTNPNFLTQSKDIAVDNIKLKGCLPPPTPTPVPTSTPVCVGSKVNVKGITTCSGSPLINLGSGASGGGFGGLRCASAAQIANMQIATGDVPQCYENILSGIHSSINSSTKLGDSLGVGFKGFCAATLSIVRGLFGVNMLTSSPTPSAGPGTSVTTPFGVVSPILCPALGFSRATQVIAMQQVIYDLGRYYNVFYGAWGPNCPYSSAGLCVSNSNFAGFYSGVKSLYLDSDCKPVTRRQTDPPICGEFDINMYINSVHSPLVLTINQPKDESEPKPFYSRFPLSKNPQDKGKWYSWPDGRYHALLVMLDKNGKVTGPEQLFGTFTDPKLLGVKQTVEKFNNGYYALSLLDKNGDGAVSRDEFPKNLALWQDNGDGVFQDNEKLSLAELGITKIFTRPMTPNPELEKDIFVDPVMGDIALAVGYETEKPDASGKLAKSTGSSFDFFSLAYDRNPATEMPVEAQTRLAGAWKFATQIRTAEETKNSNGVLVFGALGENIVGYAIAEYQLQEKDPSGAERMVRFYPLKPGVADLQTDGKIKLAFSVPGEFGKETRTTATITANGDLMEGYSQLLDAKGEVLMEYPWRATKMNL